MDQKKLIHSCMKQIAEILGDVFNLADDIDRIKAEKYVKEQLDVAINELIEAADHMQDCVSEHDDWSEEDEEKEPTQGDIFQYLFAKSRIMMKLYDEVTDHIAKIENPSIARSFRISGDMLCDAVEQLKFSVDDWYDKMKKEVGHE